ncbi:hypothetical protein DL93DRAFT_2074983 [Clavulina sp. PMI_390]|nr:hypothetical protein DL93DRAFT_2074983 [Clavulina sp. PMI_390]
MVYFAALLSAALLSSVQVMAAPIPDSAINEPGVRAPNGTPITDSSSPQATSTSNNYGGSYNNNNNNNYNNNYNNYNTYATTTSTSMMMETTSTTMMKDTTSTTMMKETTTSTSMMMDTTSTTMMMDTTSTADMTSTTTSATYSMPTYGSGYNNWNGGYDSCVQQCMNTYGSPAATYTAPPAATETSGNGGGSGTTHTVIVAPAPGVLRFYPFAVNASAGDIVHFQWNAGPHTVTQSSITTPCNKTAAPGAFASGIQNASFTFDITVNDTNTLNFYCGVPNHCEKGMFGLVNPPNANGASTTVASMMPSLISTNTDLAMQVMYVMNKTMGTSAYTWGNDMDMSGVPEDNQVAFMQNVLQTRLMFAANPGALEGNPENPNLTVPADITQITSGTSTPSNVGGASTTASGTSSTTSPSGTGTPGGSAKTGAAGVSRSVAGSAVLGVAGMVALLML